MRRLWSFIVLRSLFLKTAWSDVLDEWQSRRSAWGATARTLLRHPALLLALPLVHIIPADDSERKLVTSTALRIAPLAVEAPQAVRLARLLAEEHRGTVVMGTVPLGEEALDELRAR